MSQLHRVGLFGVGSFGYAMLRHLEQKAGRQIELRAYDRNEEIRRTLVREHRHPYHEAAAPLSANVSIVDSVARLMKDLDVLVLAVTSDSTREVMEQVAAEEWSGPLRIVNTAKALDFRTGRRLSEIVAEIVRNPPQPITYAALAGGTIANELLLQDPLGLTLACEYRRTLEMLKDIFASPTMWVETTMDLCGVEFAGAFKNVIAICAGMARGLSLPDGSVTHLISRMASEVEDLCVNRLGASPQTFRLGSQCWGSDLWMSCIGSTRNRRFGELLGKGHSLEQANELMAQEHTTIEGVRTLRVLNVLLRQYPDELRLFAAAEKVILESYPATMLIEALMRAD